MWMRCALVVVLVATASASWAAGKRSSSQVLPHPEVLISPGKQDIVEEYRINGLFYMIKITPTKGLPYYLVDSDGDGVFETRQSELTPDLLIPRWVLFKF
ncbi:MAG: DUF2782 domain-containing protein [Pseudomonadota bacterium]